MEPAGLMVTLLRPFLLQAFAREEHRRAQLGARPQELLQTGLVVHVE
jgi:hypothetical protein